MANISDIFPGGSAADPIDHAAEAASVDDSNATTGLFFWSGTQTQYDAIDSNTFPNYTRTLFNIIAG